MEVIMEGVGENFEEEIRFMKEDDKSIGIGTAVNTISSTAPEVTIETISGNVKQNRFESETGGGGGDEDFVRVAVVSSSDPGNDGGCDNLNNNETTVGETVNSKGTDKHKKTSNPKRRNYKGPPVNCPTCGKTIANSRGLAAHMLLHNDANSYQCPVCPVVLKQYVYLRRHMKACHHGMPIPLQENTIIYEVADNDIVKPACQTCGRIFTKKSSLKAHMLLHTGEKPYQCPVCPAAFRQHSHLTGHAPVVAPEVTKETTNNNAQQEPAVSETSDDNNAHASTDKTAPGMARIKINKERTDKRNCNTKTSKAKTNKHHPVTCPTCGLRLNQLYDLKKHIRRLHPGVPIPPLPNKTIIKALEEVSSDVATEAIDTFVKPEQAQSESGADGDASVWTVSDPGSASDKINNEGTEKNDTENSGDPGVEQSIDGQNCKMEISKATRYKLDPATCPICGARFTQKWYMRKHMLIHTREKPHCPVCPAAIRHGIHLIAHMKRHHPEIPIPPNENNTYKLNPTICPVCGARFTQKWSMKKHMMRLHPGIPIPPRSNKTIIKAPAVSLVVATEKITNLEQVLNKTGGDVCTDLDKINNQRTEKDDTENSRELGMEPSFDGRNCKKKYKSVTCQICEKKFNLIASLRQHMLLHTGEKPFQCPACPVAVRQYIHLKLHMKRNHPEVPIPPYENKILKTAAAVRVPKVSRRTNQKNGQINLQSVMTETDSANVASVPIVPETIASCVKEEEVQHEMDGDVRAVPVDVIQCDEETAKDKDEKDIDDKSDLQRKGSKKAGMSVNEEKSSDKISLRGYSKVGRSKSTTCPKCGKEFRQRYNMLTHLLIHADLKPYKCPSPGCPLAYRQYSNLKRHMGKYHPGELVPRNISSVFEKKSAKALGILEADIKIEPHEKFKLKEYQIRGSKCDFENGKRMSSSPILKKFNRMVSLAQSHQLPLQVEDDDGRKCVTSVDKNLLAHFLQPIYPPPPPVSGRITAGMYLDKFFPTQPLPSSPSPVGMEKAEPWEGKIEKQEQQFPSSKCAMNFIKKKSSLRLHNLPSHSNESQVQKIVTRADKRGGEGVFGCTVCGRKFKRVDIWKKHMKLHSGGKAKSHQCPTCHKCFNTATYLTTHMRIHTGERPFPCKICEKRFTQISAMKMHMRIHTGEKQFECLLKCGSRFAQYSALNNHMKGVHRGEWDYYRCRLCDATFSDKVSLNEHSASSH